MSYATLEVQLRNGRLISRSGEPLPTTAHALLVVLDSEVGPRKKDSGDISQALAVIRARQSARGHSPRSVDAVSQQLRIERESW